ncbi:MAG: GHKL domain-containing protein, partial [Gemmiger sp.]|uniref:GHKL domain-containing protein n=1 Tax=Gemmiger sp. TaxID=2049027 RepID=UPI002E79A7E2
LRCRTDKGIFMMRLENTVGGKLNPDFSTTKGDKAIHGFGLPGMREIAQRYHGTLEANVENERFVLIICLMI